MHAQSQEFLYRLIVEMETIKRSGATSEDLLQLTEKRAVAGEPLMDPTLPSEPGTAFTGGKGGFTCPQ